VFPSTSSASTTGTSSGGYVPAPSPVLTRDSSYPSASISNTTGSSVPRMPAPGQTGDE
jgi:hypothetical protein